MKKAQLTSNEAKRLANLKMERFEERLLAQLDLLSTLFDEDELIDDLEEEKELDHFLCPYCGGDYGFKQDADDCCPDGNDEETYLNRRYPYLRAGY